MDDWTIKDECCEYDKLIEAQVRSTILVDLDCIGWSDLENTDSLPDVLIIGAKKAIEQLIYSSYLSNGEK